MPLRGQEVFHQN